MKSFFVVFLIFVLAVGLRTFYLPKGALTFSYDQGRDGFIINQILKGDLKIQGPSASTPGLYHGVFYYYLLAPAYFMGAGNPYYAAVWLAIINSLTIFLIYYFSQNLFKNAKVSVLLALLFAVSYEQTQYAIWLSNPSPAVLTVPLLYLGLWAWIGNRRWGPIVSGLALGLSIHCDIFLLYHLPVIFFLWVMGRLKITRQTLAYFAIAFLVTMLSFLVSEVKFGFKSVKGLSNLFIHQDAAVVNRTLVDSLQIYINQFGKLFAFNLFPLNFGYAGVIGVFLVVYLLKSNFKYKDLLFFYLFSSVLASPFGGTSTPFINVGLAVAALLLLGYFLSRQKLWLTIVISLVLILANILYVFSNNSKGQTLFAIQSDLNLHNELAAIDYIYTSQSGLPFSLNTITAPLYINTAWSYLFNWYGRANYHYLPHWHGHDQIGLLGNNLTSPDQTIRDYYLIIDPPEPNFARYIEPGIAEENGKSKVVSEKDFGQIRVQKRIKI